ncbi:hypothetical protein BGZ72_002311, partial [Mortierella alpina]
SYGQSGRVIFREYDDLLSNMEAVKDGIKSGCSEMLYVLMRLQGHWAVTQLDLRNFRIQFGDASGRAEQGAELEVVMSLVRSCEMDLAGHWEQHWNEAMAHIGSFPPSRQAPQASADVRTLIHIEMQANQFFDWGSDPKHTAPEFHRVRFLGLLADVQKFRHDAIVMAHRAHVPDDEDAPTAVTEMAEFLSRLAKDCTPKNDMAELHNRKRRKTVKRHSASGTHARSAVVVDDESGSTHNEPIDMESRLSAFTGDQLQNWASVVDSATESGVEASVIADAKLLAHNIRMMLDWIEEEGEDDDSILNLKLTITSKPGILQRRIQLSSGGTIGIDSILRFRHEEGLNNDCIDHVMDELSEEYGCLGTYLFLPSGDALDVAGTVANWRALATGEIGKELIFDGILAQRDGFGRHVKALSVLHLGGHWGALCIDYVKMQVILSCSSDQGAGRAIEGVRDIVKSWIDSCGSPGEKWTRHFVTQQAQGRGFCAITALYSIENFLSPGMDPWVPYDSVSYRSRYLKMLMSFEAK